MNPRYKKQIFSVPWHFVKLPGSTVSRFHYKALLVLESVIRLFSSSLIDRLKSFCQAFSGSLAKAARFRFFNCAIIQGRRVSNNVLDN